MNYSKYFCKSFKFPLLNKQILFTMYRKTSNNNPDLSYLKDLVFNFKLKMHEITLLGQIRNRKK